MLKMKTRVINIIKKYINFIKQNLPKLNSYSMFSIKGILILYINYLYRGKLIGNIYIYIYIYIYSLWWKWIFKFTLLHM